MSNYPHPIKNHATWKKPEHYQRGKVTSRRTNIILLVVVCLICWQIFSSSPNSLSQFPRDSISQTDFRSRILYRKDLHKTTGSQKDVIGSPGHEKSVDSTDIEASILRKEVLLAPTSKKEAHLAPRSEPKKLEAKKKVEETKNGTPEKDDNVEKAPIKRISAASKDGGLPLAAEELKVHVSPAGQKKTDLSEITNAARFPTYSEYSSQIERADSLPDVLHFTFEDTTADVILEGWEDEWFSSVQFDQRKWGNLPEPKIDFIYTWVNGTDTAFQDTIYPFEVNSTLNDRKGKWLESHRLNRYRDWDELRYSIRSVEKYASKFRNKIQILVNAVGDAEASKATMENPAIIAGKQVPLWMKNDQVTKDIVQILTQEEFFDKNEAGCLPTFNSLTIENQIHNTKSDTDRFFALSDDMILGKPHAASDMYSPLFGVTMGFKTNEYNTRDPPTDVDARRFGEKPYLIYTSWLLNKRFGDRKRKGQVHFGHSMSRSVTREAINSFPRPALQSTCRRFRGETGFQLYSWYVAFHYTIERHREALLWSYIMLRSDLNGDGNLDWEERQVIIAELEEGMSQEGNSTIRKRQFYRIGEHLEKAGLEAPKANLDTLWTSLDGPSTIHNIKCFDFDVNECIAPGFSTTTSDKNHTNHIFSSASIFDRISRQHPKCGDCLIKLILNRVEQGLEPLLPKANSPLGMREVVIKALKKYQYTIVDPDALFVMVTDAEQVEKVLLKRLIKDKRQVGQLCLNDDVDSRDKSAILHLKENMMKLLQGIVPEPSQFEETCEDDGLRANSNRKDNEQQRFPSTQV